MLNKFKVLVVFLQLGYCSVQAVQENDIYIYKPESIYTKYDGYNTTIQSGLRSGSQAGQKNTLKHSRSSDKQVSIQNLPLLNASREMNQFQNNLDNFENLYQDLFKQQYFSSSDMRELSRQFRQEFEKNFYRQNNLLEGFSRNATNPYYQQKSIDRSLNQPYQNSPSVNRNESGKAVENSEYEAEQPVIIRWFFSSIRYLRENPLKSVIGVLLLLGLFSVLQIVIRRLMRPFG